ncbi:MAG: hypothetical protein ACTJLL_01895, partial [Anaplasma sp.]
QEKLDREFEKALSDPERKSNAERELGDKLGLEAEWVLQAERDLAAWLEFEAFLNSPEHKAALARLEADRKAMPAEQAKFDKALKEEYDWVKHKQAVARLQAERDAMPAEQAKFDQLLEEEYHASAERRKLKADQERFDKALEAEYHWSHKLRQVEAEYEALLASQAHKDAVAELEAEREAVLAEQKRFNRLLKAEYDAAVERQADAAGVIQQIAFNTFLEDALQQMMDHAAEIHRLIDDLIKNGFGCKAILDAEEQEMRDTISEVYDGSIDSVVESVFRRINEIAGYRIGSANSDVQSHADFLKGMQELESVRNMLRSFQGSTVKVMGDVLQRISEGRAAIVNKIAKFKEQARNIDQGLGTNPRKALESALNKCQEELIRAQRGTAVLEKELEQVRAVVKVADDEMSETIRSMPYKALAAVPYQGVSQMLEDALKNAGKEGWVAPEGMDQELAAALDAWAKGGELSEDAKQRLTNALGSFRAHVRESNGKVVAVFKSLFVAIMSAFQDAAQRVIMALLVRLNEVAALATVQTVVQEKAEGLDSAGQVLTDFQESVAVAVGSALGGIMDATLNGLLGGGYHFHELSPEGLTAEQEDAIPGSELNNVLAIQALQVGAKGAVANVMGSMAMQGTSVKAGGISEAECDLGTICTHEYVSVGVIQIPVHISFSRS